MNPDLAGFPVGKFVVDALFARDMTEAAIARSLRIPKSLVQPVRKGIVELTSASLNHLEKDLGESWQIIVVSSLGRPGRLTTDTLRVLSELGELESAFTQVGKRRSRPRAAVHA